MATLHGGDYVLALKCPACRTVVEAPVHLGTRLVIDDRGTAALTGRLAAKAVDHICDGRQLRITDVDGNALPDEDDQGELFRPPDGKERAAGGHERW